MTENELIEKTNQIISELVIPKHKLQKAYNYYIGKRDPEQFKYLQDNFGIGNPTAVEFIPLIKKHIDALVGEYLGTPIIPKVSCKDKSTVTNIAREKQLKIADSVQQLLKSKIENSLLQFIDGKNITDTNIEKQLQDLIEDLDKNFISEYEIAAQNVIEYIMQSRDTDMLVKLKMLFLDLLITGYTFYRVKTSNSGTNVVIEVLNPLNTFVDGHPESPYAKNATKAVVRKWLSKPEILSQYGKLLSKEDLENLKESWESTFVNTATYARTSSTRLTDGLRANEEVIPGYPDGNYKYNLIPVYEVEWLDTDSNFVMQRYETIRIGEEIFILKGLNKDVIRSADNPNHCTLSVNGVYFLNRGTEPYSLALACASLQDKYDLLHFYRDNLIANSGTTGDWIDLSLLPNALGDSLAEKLQKFIAYKKTGIAPIDTSQEGRLATGQAPLNTAFNGFDDTIKVQAIQAIQLAIDSIEQTTSSITGVFRERLNGIEQRDAVTNVKQSATNSFIITKQFYQQMDLVTVEILIDCLNQGKIVYKKGLKGILILGDHQQKIFTALPEHFTVSDHDIRICTSTDIIRDMEQVKTLIPEFIRSQQMDSSIILEALTSRSLTELKTKVQLALKKQKAENDMLNKLQQQAADLEQQLKQAQQQLQQAQQKIQQLNEAKIKLEQEKIQTDSRIKWYEAQTDRNYKVDSVAIDKKRAEIELLQLRDGNPFNDSIKY